MTKLYIKIMCILLVVITSVTLSLVPANGYISYKYSTYSTCDNVKLCKNKDQVYLVGTNDKTVYIDAIFPQSYNISLTLDNTVDAFSLCDDTLVIVCNKDSSMQKEIFLYHIETDIFESFNIVYDPNAMDDFILYDNSYVYVPLSNGKIKQYSTRGKLVNTYDTNSQITSLSLNYDGVVYATSYKYVYTISNNQISVISTDYSLPHIRFIDDNIFVDKYGGFYKINSSQIDKIASYNSDFTELSGGICNNYAITFCYDTVYALNITTKKLEKQLKFDSNISQLFSLDDKIFVLTYLGATPFVMDINFSDLINIPQQNNNLNNTATTNTISSNKYTIDFENSIIADIKPATTVAQFKKNLSCSGFDVKLYKYNKDTQLTSGAIGTGTTATFVSDKTTYKFTLTIKGDITGEGNINSRDKSIMFKHILGNAPLDSVFLNACDIDTNENINICDIILLLRLIEQ